MNRPGPRYTSYPTAPVWTENVGSLEARELIAGILDEREELSLYAHLPFCPRHCHFCGCNVIITSNREVIGEYVQVLNREIQQSAPLFAGRKIHQMQWGGGSPTHLTPDEIKFLARSFRKHFDFVEDAEVGIEINPQFTTPKLLDAIKEAGFNRISMGIQDFDPKVQKIINRVQPYEQVVHVMQWVRERFSGSSVNMDLIYGMPYQTIESFRITMEQVLELNPDRVALYSYAHVPWLKPLMRLFPQNSLADQNEKMQIFLNAAHDFLEAGYKILGFDHFARENDALYQAYLNKELHRNFMGYTTKRGMNLFGLGMTSISQIEGSFLQNHKKLSLWREAVEAGQMPIYKGHICSSEDLLRQELIARLMCQLELDIEDFSCEFELDFAQKFAQEISELGEHVQSGLLKMDTKRLEVTDLGRLFLRNLCLPFDTYFREQQKTLKPMFSQTV